MQVFGIARVDTSFAYSWQSKDAAFAAPSRVQVISQQHPFKSGTGAGRFGSAKGGEDFTVGRLSACPASISANLPVTLSPHHLDQSLNGPRAPPSI